MLAMAAVDGDGHMLAGAGACRLGSRLLRLRFFVSSHAGVEQSKGVQRLTSSLWLWRMLASQRSPNRRGRATTSGGETYRIDVEAEDEAIAGRAAAQLAADLRELPGRA